MIPERIKVLALDALVDLFSFGGRAWPQTKACFPIALDLDEALRFKKRIDLGLPAMYFKRRVIWSRDGKVPYLARFYVTAPPTMSDGSEPFDKQGELRPGASTGEGGWIPRVYVHHFYRGDDDSKLHNHPWKWALSLILAGGYSEELRTKHDTVRRKVFRPGMLNLLTQKSFHRVDLLDKDRGSWSLFVVGKRASSWGFWDRFTKKVVDWKDYLPNEHKPEMRP